MKTRIKYYYGVPNFGDELNLYILRHLYNIPTEPVPEEYDDKPHLMFIGSMIRMATSNTVIWGAGLIDQARLPRHKPSYIGAVRGPLTQRKLMQYGFLSRNDSPILGDPALLLASMAATSPPTAPSYDIGIIPHYADKPILKVAPRYSTLHPRLWLSPLRKKAVITRNGNEIHCRELRAILIDVQKPCEQVIRQIHHCKFIASSSLHGLIVADAFGIPNTWVKFGDNLDGGAFKFVDYMLSVGRYDVQPMVLESTRIDDVFLQKALERRDQWSLQFDFESYRKSFENFLRSQSFQSCSA